MNESVSTAAKSAPREQAKPPRTERMEELRKKQVKTGAVAAGGLLALVGLAAMLLGA
ncbi:hypothetical protein OU994_28350 [Pseudoduganella sp. SL102]|uniref:Uncharacterized protein n=1 Tax=Pseudoduganella albidiflava TaxID=321983 RepID=A0AA87XVX6_9BURK|nr:MULTISPECIES: hypothetical protein [Pseudoduganella]WBS02121.1 hypothetical protein OU994_28350 [Pseudoduganella sp. SL102]GGY54549.1 hypothetical protein GCM10007387_41110 [Pseudoduganella albidiflava]